MFLRCSLLGFSIVFESRSLNRFELITFKNIKEGLLRSICEEKKKKTTRKRRIPINLISFEQIFLRIKKTNNSGRESRRKKGRKRK